MASLVGNVDKIRSSGVEVEKTSGRRNQPAATGTACKEVKKKKKNTNKEKNKPQSEVKKRGHPSTPNSDDSEKQQTDQWTSKSDQKQSKSHTKEKASRKCRKSKTTQAPTLAKEDNTEVIIHTQDSLRWEGVLDDPVAEAQRLEVYKANRRKRYLVFRQTL